MESIQSVPDVCQVEIVSPEGTFADAPDYLFEIPHGATSHEHYMAIRRRLVGRLPDDLEAFYFVNTDVGAFECARQAARMIAGAAPPRCCASCSGQRPRLTMRAAALGDDRAQSRPAGRSPTVTAS